MDGDGSACASSVDVVSRSVVVVTGVRYADAAVPKAQSKAVVPNPTANGFLVSFMIFSWQTNNKKLN
jgi:hypothetical protein